MSIKNTDVLKVLGPNLKKARLAKNYTQEFVAENVNISTDLLRNIENGRNIGSIPTLLNLCNFLNITPNYLFFNLIDKENQSLDNSLKNYFSNISEQSRDALKQIIIHIDKNY
jgi:transcriptional regulator with XRE-family HTH domain